MLGTILAGFPSSTTIACSLMTNGKPVHATERPSKLSFVQNFTLHVIYMLFAGREVRIGKNCARGLQYPRPRAQFFPIQTDLGRQITCLLFSSVEYFVRSFCVEFSLQPFSKPGVRVRLTFRKMIPVVI